MIEMYEWLGPLKPFIPPLFYIVIFPGLVILLVLLLIIIWLERKIAGKVQLRYGPLYVSRIIGGGLQTISDLLRYTLQEIIPPKEADKPGFILIPGLMIAFSLMPVAFIPVGSYFPLAINVSLLAAVALITLNPLLIILIGWASTNKFSVIGSLREAFMMISYEIPFLITILSMIIIFNSLDLLEIVNKQATVWGVLLNPVAALVFLITAARSTAKFPFEIAEAESEIIMGPYTEYSGLYFGIVMGVSYMELYAYSLIFADLFLGGWLPVTGVSLTGIGLIDHMLLPGLVTVAKAFVVMVVMVFLRSVYPRYRVDQAIRIGWERIFPLSLLALFISMGLVIGGVAL